MITTADGRSRRGRLKLWTFASTRTRHAARCSVETIRGSGGVVAMGGRGEHDQTPPYPQAVYPDGGVGIGEQLGQQRPEVRIVGEVESDEVFAESVRAQRYQRCCI